MANTLRSYWKRYEAISPWVAMYAYVTTFVLWGIAFLAPMDERLTLALLVIPFGVALDQFLHTIQTGKPNWQSALITSAIVTLLLPPGVDWFVGPLAVALAIGSKHFLLVGKGKRHVFNPAGFGIAVTALIFGYSLGWWPDSFLWLTLGFGLLNVWRIKKFPQVLTFLLAYSLLTVLANGALPTAGLDFSNLGTQTLPVILPYFFALFMVPEPMTSLEPRDQQLEFGLVTALAGFAIGYVPVLAPAAIVWGLLVANAYAALRRQRA